MVTDASGGSARWARAVQAHPAPIASAAGLVLVVIERSSYLPRING